MKFSEKWRLIEIMLGSKAKFWGVVAPLLPFGYVPVGGFEQAANSVDKNSKKSAGTFESLETFKQVRITPTIK